MPKKYTKPSASQAQVRQRELAWMLYIVKGLEANVAAARVRNFTTYTDEDDFVIETLREALDTAMESLRTLLNEIPQEAK